jgi:hypothetical protein
MNPRQTQPWSHGDVSGLLERRNSSAGWNPSSGACELPRWTSRMVQHPSQGDRATEAAAERQIPIAI